MMNGRAAPLAPPLLGCALGHDAALAVAVQLMGHSRESPTHTPTASLAAKVTTRNVLCGAPSSDESSSLIHFVHVSAAVT